MRPPGETRPESPRSALRPFLLPGAIIGVAALACVLFTGLTPPLLTESALGAFGAPGAGGAFAAFASMTPDRAFYWIRFGASALLLGLLPAWVLSWFKVRLADTGLRMPAGGARATFGSGWFLIALAAAPVVGALGSFSPDIGAYYPYSRDLVAMTREGGIWPVLGHLAAYFFLYYLPWEFFFRGFLLFPFLRGIEEKAFQGGADPGGEGTGRELAMATITAIVLFQTIPSTLLHFGHPLGELLSAIPAGAAFGILAWRTKSILPGLFLHAGIGFGTDIAIIVRALAAGGVAP